MFFKSKSCRILYNRVSGNNTGGEFSYRQELLNFLTVICNVT